MPEETQISQRFNLRPLAHVAHVFSGSLLHWSQSSSERADSLAVETSSYVLLAVLSKTTLTAADLGYAARLDGITSSSAVIYLNNEKHHENVITFLKTFSPESVLVQYGLLYR